MKVLLRRLADWLLQRSPLTTTVIGLLLALAIGVPDYFTPRSMTFTLFYFLAVIYVGWGAGKRPAFLMSVAVVLIVGLAQWVLPQQWPRPEWVVIWNVLSRLVAFCLVGWVAAELAHLTRSLRALVDERTAQWKAETAEHKATAGRLAEAIERFEEVIHNITEVFWLSDVSKEKILFISPGYARVWGRKCEELYREPESWLAAVHPADREAVARCARTEQAAGRYDVEYRILRPDGAERWIRDRAFPVRNAEGEVCRIAGIAEDITERKRTERIKDALLSLGTRLSAAQSPSEAARAVFAAADDFWSSDTAVLDICSPATDTTRHVLCCDVIDGRRCELPAESRDEPVTARMRRIMRDGPELILRQPPYQPPVDARMVGDVSRPSASIMSVPVRWEGQAIGVLSVQSYRPNAYTQEDLRTLQALADPCAGALERLRAGAAVRESEQTYRALVETTGTGYLILDMEGRVVDANEEYVRLSGHQTLQEILGRTVLEWTAEGDRARNAAAVKECLRTGAVRNLEVTYAGPNGVLIPIDINGTVVETSRGRNILSLCRDISERRRADLTREVVLSMGAKLSAARTPIEAARTMYAAADQLWDWDSATMSLCPADSSAVEPVLFVDVMEGQRREVPAVLPSGIPTARMRRVMQQGPELILRREGEPPDAETIRFGDISRASASIMCVPLRREGRPVGFLSIQSYRHDAFTPQNLRTLAGLADYCGGALERIRVESALRESGELLRTFYDSPGSLRAIVELLEDDLLVVSANAPQAAFYGLSTESVCHKRASDLGVPQAVVELWIEKFRQSQRDGTPVTFEYSADFRSPGSWGLATVSPLRSTRAKPPRFAYVAVDITERKRAERVREAFLSLGAKLSVANTPREAAEAVLAGADQLWKWDAAVLQLYSVERDCLDSLLLIDLVDGERREVPPPYPDSTPPPVMRRIMQNGPELILRTPADTQGCGFVAFGDMERLSASLMYAPLRREGQTVGVLSVQSYAFNAYTPQDLQTLQALADYCGGALQRIHAEAALRAAHAGLERRVQERTVELQAANASLRRTNAILQAINQGTDNLICLKDAQGKVMMVNPAMARFLGKTEAELVGTDDLESLPNRRQAAEIRETDCRIMTTGHSETVEEAVDLPNRQWHCLFTKSPYRDAEGNVIGVIGIGTNITERKAMEQALRQAHDQLEERVRERTAELRDANAALQESEERYRSLVNNLSVGIFRVTPESGGRVIQANPALARIHGYDSVEEFQNLRVVDLYQDPRDRATYLSELLKQGTLLKHEVRLRKRDGTPIYGSLNVRLHRDAQGQPDWIDGVLEDITERKKAEEALRASEERYRTLTECSPDSIFILDRDCRLQYVNSVAAASVKRAPEELIGLAQAELFPPETARGHQQAVREVFETGKPVHHDELLALAVGDRWAEVRLAPLYDAQATITSIMGISRDITPRKCAEQELAEALDLNQRILAASPIGIEAFKASGECIFANQATCTIVGGTLQEILRRNFRKLQSWKKAGILKLAEAALTSGRAQVAERRWVSSFGREVWADLRLAPFTRGGQVHLLCMYHDVSERKRTEAALREAERLRKAILDNIPDPAWLKDAEGRFLAGNEALAHSYGRPLAAIIGKTVSDFAPEEVSRVTREDGKVMRSRQPLRAETPFRRPDGQVRWFESIKSPLLDQQDKVTGTVGIARDISDYKRSELLLRAQRDLGVALGQAADLSVALNHLLDIAMEVGGLNFGGVYLLDSGTGGMSLVAHRGASSAFIKTVAHWATDSPQMRLVRRGRPIFSLYQGLPLPHDEAGRQEGLRASALIPLFHEGKAIGALTLASKLLDEIPRQTELTLEAITAQAAGALARIGAETERRRLERQILEISDRQQASIGQEIHDGLCQQLVSLAFDANSLRRQLSDRRRPEAKTALRIARDLDQAISEARLLSRGLFPARLASTGLPPALEELARTTAVRFKLRCRFTSRGPVAAADNSSATHLYRIAQEAVANAIKHSQARSVSIRLRADAKNLELSVEDDGRGLAAASRKQDSGLGLHIMDYRARAIGGTFRLSRSRRGGTLVSCCVPRRRS